jgi:mono/diheme cytochrome c family protein
MTRAMLCAGLLFVAAAGSAQVRERDPGWMAPGDAGARVNPLAGRPNAAAGGRKLFEQRCATCHGVDGRGTVKGPDLSQPDVQAQPDGALFWKITSGNSRRGMPTFSFLPEAQRWQLVLWVRSFSSPPCAVLSTTGARATVVSRIMSRDVTRALDRARAGTLRTARPRA